MESKLIDRLRDLRNANVLDYSTYCELHDMAATMQSALSKLRNAAEAVRYGDPEDHELYDAMYTVLDEMNVAEGKEPG
jgi:uncharacterized protein with von Willebrand factor type A (vWA) domain